MATVCGGTLALMDAGVPLKKPVAGIAMGLVKEGEQYAILSDIAGEEDHYGDMDFKVTGTKDGITALQMDLKVEGLTREIMAEALAQARRGVDFILGKIVETIAEPRRTIPSTRPGSRPLRFIRTRSAKSLGQAERSFGKLLKRADVRSRLMTMAPAWLRPRMVNPLKRQSI